LAFPGPPNALRATTRNRVQASPLRTLTGPQLLTVQTGQSITGQTAELPIAALAMIARLPGVYQVQSAGATNACVYRSPLIPRVDTNALPTDAWAGGLAAALLIGALAGLLPAIRAARLSPPRPSGACDPGWRAAVPCLPPAEQLRFG
jgi:hypothetical protein